MTASTYNRADVVPFLHRMVQPTFTARPPNFRGDLMLEQVRALLNMVIIVGEMVRLHESDPLVKVLQTALDNEQAISAQMEALRKVGAP